MDMIISLKWRLGIICGFSLFLGQTMERGGATISEPRPIRIFMTWIVPNLESQMGLGLDLSSVTLDKPLPLPEPATFLCTRNWRHTKNILPYQMRFTLQSLGVKECAHNCKALHQLLLAHYLLFCLLNKILKEQTELLHKTTTTSVLAANIYRASYMQALYRHVTI